MSKTIKVPLKDESGKEIGVTVDLAADGETLADRIEGWSMPFEVGGASYPYSKARAAALVARFPHFAQQLEKAGKPATSSPTKDDSK